MHQNPALFVNFLRNNQHSRLKIAQKNLKYPAVTEPFVKFEIHTILLKFSKQAFQIGSIGSNEDLIDWDAVLTNHEEHIVMHSLMKSFQIILIFLLVKVVDLTFRARAQRKEFTAERFNHFSDGIDFLKSTIIKLYLEVVLNFLRQSTEA